MFSENKNKIAFQAKNKSIYMTKEKINSLLKDKENVKDFNQLGANLNLNIAQKLITAHSWDVIANSDRDNSSTFGFVVKK
jgi:light-regulated signal transduction histidine kinase (bacteriophytochrome)